MLTLDRSTLDRIIAKALLDAAAHPRWVVAIGRAAVELDQNPYIERGDHGLIIGSPSSGNCYAANGICQCQAFKFNQPCWHRACARLVRLYDEAQAKAEIDADLTAKQTRWAEAQAQIDEIFAY